MINLLPLEDKILNKKGYLHRVGVIVLIFIFILTFFATIVLLPVYLSLFLEEKGMLKQVDVMNKIASQNFYSETIFEVDNINNQVEIFIKNEKKFHKITLMIDKILLNKPNGISIKRLEYNNNKKETILVNGESRTRDLFLNFKDKLNEEKIFLNIISPSSNLLKDKDNEFTITLEL